MHIAEVRGLRQRHVRRPLILCLSLCCVCLNISECSFVADGRFHLESMMIQNPQVKAFYRFAVRVLLCCSVSVISFVVATSS